ncbi:MAG: hypothetical protein OXB84_06505 [Halobacteriovoraceae bacterium]|nr:hypothetical protein [Halobacteriovoraceae bacterium]
MKLILFFSFFCMSSVCAVPVARVYEMTGEVKYSGKALKKDDVLSENGIITTGKGSSIKLVVDFWRGFLTLNANTSLKVGLWGKGLKKGYFLMNGSCEWMEKRKEKGSKIQGRLFHTSNTTVKVEKGDMLLVHDDILQETEILVFKGKSILQSQKDPNDRIIIKKGIWGGIGGRFGDTIGEIMALPLKKQKYFLNKKRY